VKYTSTNALEDVKLENVELLKEKKTRKRKPVTTLSVTNAWGEHDKTKPSVSNAWGDHGRAKPSTMKDTNGPSNQITPPESKWKKCRNGIEPPSTVHKVYKEHTETDRSI